MTALYFNKELFAYLILKNEIFNLHKLADKLKVDYNTVIRWRNGTTKPLVENVNNIAKYFKVELKSLYKTSDTDIDNNKLSNEYTKEFLNENN